MGTSTPRTEVRVRSSWLVAMRRALSAYSVNLLILYYVWNERDIELSAAKTLKLDVLVLEPLLCNLNSMYGCACVMIVTPGFKDKTECIAICMPGSSFIHIETS